MVICCGKWKVLHHIIVLGCSYLTKWDVGLAEISTEKVMALYFYYSLAWSLEQTNNECTDRRVDRREIGMMLGDLPGNFSFLFPTQSGKTFFSLLFSLFLSLSSYVRHMYFYCGVCKRWLKGQFSLMPSFQFGDPATYHFSFVKPVFKQHVRLNLRLKEIW